MDTVMYSDPTWSFQERQRLQDEAIAKRRESNHATVAALKQVCFNPQKLVCTCYENRH